MKRLILVFLIATLTPIANITDTGGEALTFTVTYSDDVAVSTSTLGNTNILVTGPRNFSQLASVVSVNDSSSGSPRVVTYRINAPGGTWNATDTGTYTIGLADHQVSDISSNFIAASTLGHFAVSIPDVMPPTATLKAASVTRGGASVYTFKVIYRDDVGVRLASIGNGDVKVTARGFSQIAKLVSKATKAGVVTATYKITPPGGTWNRADNKRYSVILLGNQVFDTSNNAAINNLLGTFSVAIA